MRIHIFKNKITKTLTGYTISALAVASENPDIEVITIEVDPKEASKFLKEWPKVSFKKYKIIK